MLDKQVLRKILFYFFASRAFFIIFAIWALLFIPLREGYLGSQFDPNAPYLAWIWANFDGRHYLDITTKGYLNTNFAFFPLYSFLLSIVGYILPIPHIYLGILMSSLFTLTAMYFIFNITKLDFGNKVGIYAIYATAFIPLSFFFHSVYTDSLFLSLSTASFYYARKRKWWLSGLFAGLSFFDRFSAIALIPGLAVEWYIQNKNRKTFTISNFLRSGFVAISLCALGLIVYLVYLELVHGNFLLFQKARSAWGSDKFVLPLQTVYRYIKIFWFLDKNLVEFWVAVLEFVSIFFYFGLSYLVAKKVRLSYGVFMSFLLIIVPATGTFAGNPRYALHLFAFYIIFALWMKNNPRFKNTYLLIFLIFGFILTALFTRGYFIT